MGEGELGPEIVVRGQQAVVALQLGSLVRRRVSVCVREREGERERKIKREKKGETVNNKFSSWPHFLPETIGQQGNGSIQQLGRSPSYQPTENINNAIKQITAA